MSRFFDFPFFLGTLSNTGRTENHTFYLKGNHVDDDDEMKILYGIQKKIPNFDAADSLSSCVTQQQKATWRVRNSSIGRMK